jgi:hypothetical protein
LEESITSIFLVQEYTKEETSIKQAARKLYLLPDCSTVRMGQYVPLKFW